MKKTCREKIYKNIHKGCPLKMDISGNIECSKQREIIAGLGGCLCKAENCFKLKPITELEAELAKAKKEIENLINADIENSGDFDSH